VNVLVTGASGFIGRAVVARCLDDGMTVTAVTRDSSRVTPADRLRVVELAADDPAGWPEALAGHDAVIHCVGIGGTGDGRASTAVSDATATLVSAMTEAGVPKLVALSNVGAGSSANQGAWVYRHVLRPVLLATFLRWLAPIIADKSRMEELIIAAAPDYTIIRLPNVVDRPPVERLRLSSGRAAVGLSITRADLASFVVAATRGITGLSRTAVSLSN
jgi:nucleoside-diphosphate-sugar epimerase